MAHANGPGSGSRNSTVTPQRDGGAAQPPAPRFKLTQTAVILGAFVLIIGGVLLLLQLFVARRLPEMTQVRFEAAHARWEKNGPASYDMDILVHGAREREEIVHIEVRDGQPTTMTRDGMVPAEQSAWNAWTVPGMFQMLVEEFALRDDPTHKGQGAPGAEIWLRSEFDRKFGYPRIYQRLMTGGGPQIEWNVTKFEPK